MSNFKFSPEAYVLGNISKETCDHFVLSTNALDEGLYGRTYNCLICGESIHVDHTESIDEDSKYIIDLMAIFSINDVAVVQKIIKEICLQNLGKEDIDIVSILRERDKEIKATIAKLNDKSIKKIYGVKSRI